MSYYPLLVDLFGKEVLVVGGGQVARRKIDSLLEAGAVVKLVAADLSEQLQEYVEEGAINYLGREFRERYLENSFMVFAATSDRLLNIRVSRCARERGILVNAVDQPSDCSFILPSVLRRGDLLICVSTSGKSPALARRIREGLKREFGEEYGIFLTLMGELRQEILRRRLGHEEKRIIFYRLVDSPLLRFVATKQWERAASLVRDVTGVEWTGEDIVRAIEASQRGKGQNEPT